MAVLDSLGVDELKCDWDGFLAIILADQKGRLVRCSRSPSCLVHVPLQLLVLGQPFLMASIVRSAPEGPAGQEGTGSNFPRRQGHPHRGFNPMHHPPQPPQPPQGEQVDREKTGDHHRLEDFARRGQEPSGEVQIYTWPDATLRELTDLIKEVHVDARKPTTRLSFALVYPDKKGRNVVRQVGETHASRGGEDDGKTLKSINFQTGDFLDVAIKVGRGRPTDMQ